MLLVFQRRFEAKVLDHSKRHTIRAKRKGKRQWRVGDVCDCYGDGRQKTMHLLGRWPCVKVQDIRIFELRIARRQSMPAVEIDGVLLTRDERERLAVSDGFTSFARMMDFWEGRLPFRGDIIHWDPTARKPESTKARKHESQNSCTIHLHGFRPCFCIVRMRKLHRFSATSASRTR